MTQQFIKDVSLNKCKKMFDTWQHFVFLHCRKKNNQKFCEKSAKDEPGNSEGRL